MGMFLSLSGIINRSASDVQVSLSRYLKSQGGDLINEEAVSDHPNFCVIKECNGNTSVLYPYGFLNWDECSCYLSNDLNTTVLSFHIHDGDFWMYVLFVSGEIKDQFCPIPDYWDSDISMEEQNTWKGDVDILVKYIPSLEKETIKSYLVRWDAEEEYKAYEDDEYTNCDWQLIDFMNKVQLPYPIDNDDNVTGQTYKLWTKDLPLVHNRNTINTATKALKKPWWKLW
ncbi:hypothetical protein [Mucilaginibacter sp. CSA2-8R]|uniref:hypothetical protein n=1 Tax=Mucilaginibacter sp. CSA2-8R TaxID=3141542 RepID=UPI00315E031C